MRLGLCVDGDIGAICRDGAGGSGLVVIAVAVAMVFVLVENLN